MITDCLKIDEVLKIEVLRMRNLPMKEAINFLKTHIYDIENGDYEYLLSLYNRKSYQIELTGFNASTDKTDHLLLWVMNCSTDDYNKIKNHKAVNRVTDLELSYTKSCGIDYDLISENIDFFNTLDSHI
jgi:hypothetical protein